MCSRGVCFFAAFALRSLPAIILPGRWFASGLPCAQCENVVRCVRICALSFRCVHACYARAVCVCAQLNNRRACRLADKRESLLWMSGLRKARGEEALGNRLLLQLWLNIHDPLEPAAVRTITMFEFRIWRVIIIIDITYFYFQSKIINTDGHNH